MQALPMTYRILTWGCQMNDEDSEQIALFLEGMGCTPTPDERSADILLLNTCAVRQKPVEKVYSKLGEVAEWKRERPETIVGVCGCMAQIEAARIRRQAPFVDLVVGTGNLGAIPSLIRSVLERRERQPNGHGPHGGPLLDLDLPERKGSIVTDVPLRNLLRRPKLKAHVPVMYGCDKFCAFCIVPITRGRERSRPTSEILQEIEALARGGTKEVTLLGQTVNSYGKNLEEGRVPFARLLDMISEIRGIRRIRFTSPYPRDFTDELIEAIARLPKVCKHIHLPLQAADDDLLLSMRRGYTVAEYAEIVRKLRGASRGIAITTDLMLGFPGETEAQFENTMRFVEETRFDSAFMFAYSIRPGTRAAEMDNQVPKEVKIRRLNELIEMQNRITCEVNAAQAGRVFEVLVEGRSPKDRSKLTGLTDTGKTVNFPGEERLIGRLAPVRAVEGHLWGFTGEAAED